MTRVVKVLGLVALAGFAICASVSSAQAAFGIRQFKTEFLNENGSPVTQAGLHPFAMRTSFALNRREEGEEVFPEAAPKDIVVTPPLGLAGNPTATERCTGSEFATIPQGTSLPSCPNSSAIGTAAVLVSPRPGLPSSKFTEFVVPLYNVEPAPGAALKLGFVVLAVPLTIEAGLSESTPYRVVAPTTNISQALIVYGAELTLWGIPAASVHDPERGNCVRPTVPTHDGKAVSDEKAVSEGLCGAEGVAEKPFLTMPRTCGPMTTTYSLDSWLHPGRFLPNHEADLTDANWLNGADSAAPDTQGCDKVLSGFGPQISAQPSSHAAGSASGLELEVNVSDPALEDPSPSAVATSDVKRVEVEFPVGVTVNPSQAEGLAACSEADLARETLETSPGEGCPNASRIGSLEVETPLLEGETLTGGLFLATPYANPTGKLIALYMVFRDRKLGVIVKQPIEVLPDPQTGQLRGISDGLPQLPFSSFRLHFTEGPRSPLVTPSACGTYTTTAHFTPWADPSSTYTTTSNFSVDSNCPNGAPSMHPTYQAGTINNTAGSYSPFSVRITRRDDDQPLTALAVKLPPGVTGKLAGLQQCPPSAIEAARGKSGDEEKASPSCPSGSLIGHVLSGAGVGGELTYVPGSLYLAGPFEGNPLSVVAIVPAVAGPFDIGNVVVQEGLNFNPSTYLVEVTPSPLQPLPQILEGIPLHLSEVRINTDRSDFTINPTSCAPEQSSANLFGVNDQVFSASDRFQAANCGALGFKPAVQLSLSGATKRTGHPALKAVVTYPKGSGYANIARAQVGLPHSEFLDQGNIGTVCTQAQLKSDTCPKRSIYGHAKAWTPLLNQPLEGPVYLGVGYGHKLPDLVADLNGEVRILLHGRIDTTKEKGIRSTFEVVPDAPVSRFVLEMKGGSRYGLLENSENICRGKRHANAQFVAQNGRIAQLRPTIGNSCQRNVGGTHQARSLAAGSPRQPKR
jgi:hypothetical protein